MTVTRSATARHAARPLLLLVAAGVLLGALFSLLGGAIRHTGPGAELRLMRHLEQGPSATVTVIAKALSVLGSQSVLVPLAVVVCVLLVVRRARRVAVLVAASAIGGIALSNAVKAVVGRPRPSLVHLVHVASPSFPSGHATQTAAILPALAIGAVAFGARRSVAIAIAVAASLMIGVSRVLLGVHYPSDVVAGWLLGGAWFAITYVVVAAAEDPALTAR